MNRLPLLALGLLLVGCASNVDPPAPNMAEPETVIDAGGGCADRIRTRPTAPAGMVSAFEECPAGQALVDAGCQFADAGPYDSQEITRFDGGILCGAAGQGSSVTATVNCCPPGAHP